MQFSGQSKVTFWRRTDSRVELLNDLGGRPTRAARLVPAVWRTYCLTAMEWGRPLWSLSGRATMLAGGSSGSRQRRLSKGQNSIGKSEAPYWKKLLSQNCTRSGSCEASRAAGGTATTCRRASRVPGRLPVRAAQSEGRAKCRGSRVNREGHDESGSGREVEILTCLRTRARTCTVERRLEKSAYLHQVEDNDTHTCIRGHMRGLRRGRGHIGRDNSNIDMDTDTDIDREPGRQCTCSRNALKVSSDRQPQLKLSKQIAAKRVPRTVNDPSTARRRNCVAASGSQNN